MDRAAIEDLFAYTDYTWREYANAVKELGPDALTKPAPGSGWPSLRDALGHINWAYERWLSDPCGTTPGASTPRRSVRGTNWRPSGKRRAVDFAPISIRYAMMSWRRSGK